ncbi:DNA-binding response regulator, OmpR family, contains REC and winged-helix (wHTH) domain [Paenibacillus sp. cl141a]|uniref:response regulator transcription factor n=1 Tax=Paenibacillus sp. cl141a TaxID=1761877 RepID=UPI0008C79848|nr:response regulator transcription factor [Paenibacillus sp. cl141a]SEL99638.1 DNA-binding response regulator, OmpR family, contains REC and winged-helix (wHTH) domain [Paenibacillus sp. cl141a]
MSEITILMVDDEVAIINLMRIYLKNEGYKLLQACSGYEALELIRIHKVDLIILDVMMPQMDGIQTCMKIREENNLPIIMLSAKSQDIDKITGLSIGADDYVTKPFSPLELTARVKSQLRRYTHLNSRVVQDEQEIRIHELIINTVSRRLTVAGEEVKLTPKEFAVLHTLAVNRGFVLSMDKIYTTVWNQPFMESKNSIIVHIRKLRKKIEKDPQHPEYIKTVWGIGYKFE